MSSNPSNLDIKIQDINGSQHTLRYNLCDNPIAKRWYRKIYHLQQLPLDDCYTPRARPPSVEELQSSMRNDVSLLQQKISLEYPMKSCYDQQDFNYLHALTVSTQYDYDTEIRDIFHRLHRTLHRLEQQYTDRGTLPRIHAGWGEKEGLLGEVFDIDPYQYYESMKPGHVYLVWAEFGKTPYDYWRDNDIDNEESFLKNCRSHTTFRAQFTLSLRYIDEIFPEEFEIWFKRYQSAWKNTHGIGWTPIHQWGGIPLCRPELSVDHKDTDRILGIKIS